MMKKFLLTALLSAMFAVSAQAADVISMNWESWGGGPINATPTAGIPDVGFWNDHWQEATEGSGTNASNSENDSKLNLKDSNGVATTMDIAWIAGGVWSANMWGNPGVDADGTQNSQILKSYLDARPGLSAETCTITISEVPYGAFDLYVYFNSDTADRAGSITVNDTHTYYFLTSGNNFIAANDHATNPAAKKDYSFVQATATTPEEAIRSNYIFIEGISGVGDTVIVTDVPQGGGICAVQVVENAYQAYVSPDNGDGTVGEAISLQQAEVTFNWNAAADPNYAVNPKIDTHDLYISLGGVDDPNVYYKDTIEQVHNADPALTDPFNSYGVVALTRGETYYWQVRQNLSEGDPIVSPIWSFTVVSANAKVDPVIPAYVAVEAGNDVELSVVGTAVDSYQWYKIGEPEDVALVNGDDYAGVDTDTLTILGTQQADEGKYFCKVENAISDASNRDTGAAVVYTKRLTSSFEFETLADGQTPDSVGGFDITMNKTTPEGEEPIADAVLVDALAELGGKALSLAGNSGTTVSGNFAAMKPGVVDHEDITISLWVNRQGGNNWQRVIDCGNNTNSYIFITGRGGDNGDQCRFAVKNGATEYFLATAAIPENTWTQITAVLDGNTGRLYIDGVFMIDGNMPVNPVDIAAANNYLGKSMYNDSYFKGDIDNLKIYNYARTTEQIALDYLAVRGEWICNREDYNLPYDFDDNCQVDLLDYAAFANSWMNSYRIHAESQE